MSAGLTTHVLDTSREGPAEGVSVTLQRLEEDSETIASGITNDDGRLEEPLLGPEEIEPGTMNSCLMLGRIMKRNHLEAPSSERSQSGSQSITQTNITMFHYYCHRVDTRLTEGANIAVEIINRSVASGFVNE